MVNHRLTIRCDIPGNRRIEHTMMRFGRLAQRSGYLQIKLWQNRHMHLPQTAHHLLGHCVIEIAQNADMEINILTEESLAGKCVLCHLCRNRTQFRLRNPV